MLILASTVKLLVLSCIPSAAKILGKREDRSGVRQRSMSGTYDIPFFVFHESFLTYILIRVKLPHLDATLSVHSATGTKIQILYPHRPAPTTTASGNL